ncbi:hypothetical protein [Oenococcus oeni]|uniref:hypothetical protein n=1 Tax=Oenococcus oeni TaxID=1247 RepID=UPI0008F90DCF|nr:hypothetical protein [Oenococcus oeni]OIM23893.1 hypothetical protein ATX61_09865 [Oenococcus oeni]SYW14282.1 hypothetical protein OENI_470001 [Oenococcus oeni]
MELTSEQKKDILKRFKNYDMDQAIRRNAIMRKNKQIEIVNMNITQEDQQQMKCFEKIQQICQKPKVMKELATSSYFDLINLYSQQNQKIDENNQVNKLVVNFVSDEKLFIDFLENWCQNNLDKNWRIWRNLQTSNYDSNLSYRLCYHLRNFVQHRGLPISKISGKIISVNGKESKKFDYLLNIAELSEDHQFQSKLKVRQDFFQSADNRSFMPYAMNYAVIVNSMYIYAMQLYIEAHLQEINQIKAYFSQRGLIYQSYWIDTTKRKMLKGQFINKMYPVTTLATIDKFMIGLTKEKIINVTFSPNQDDSNN